MKLNPNLSSLNSVYLLFISWHIYYSKPKSSDPFISACPLIYKPWINAALFTAHIWKKRCKWLKEMIRTGSHAMDHILCPEWLPQSKPMQQCFLTFTITVQSLDHCCCGHMRAGFHWQSKACNKRPSLPRGAQQWFEYQASKRWIYFKNFAKGC